jgi:hypothetical protein
MSSISTDAQVSKGKTITGGTINNNGLRAVRVCAGKAACSCESVVSLASNSIGPILPNLANEIE